VPISPLQEFLAVQVPFPPIQVPINPQAPISPTFQVHEAEGGSEVVTPVAVEIEMPVKLEYSKGFFKYIYKINDKMFFLKH
jgi:hypothetical protein